MNPPDTSCDHDEIRAVIARETDAFVTGDFGAWAACWVKDARTREVCFSSTFGAQVLEGWDAIETYMKAVFDGGSACQIADFQRKNWSITLSGNLAYVAFDGHSRHIDGRVEATFETRVLQKEAHGPWLILYASFVLKGHQRADADRVMVDTGGIVRCAPDNAIAVLRDHCGLQISNGKLRASKPAWDKVLQAALSCAAQQHGFFQHYRYETQNGQQFRLPVVLGQTDEGGVLVCVLFVRDGMTFVEARNDKDIKARMAVAKAIFGLSSGQMALAGQIVLGKSLIAASKAMGISNNTARTHLSRIYVKTGVNSQTALVRTLLSVG